MKFWGTTIDPSKATSYELPLVDDVLPPTNDPIRPIIETSPTTTEHSKPTAYLTGGSHSAADDIQHWFNGMKNAVSSHRSYVGIVGLVVILAIFSGICFWKRRRAARLRTPYNVVSTREDVEMDEARRVGPVSAGRHPLDRVSQGLGFHSSFLDDDEVTTAGPTPKYRDLPDRG